MEDFKNSLTEGLNTVDNPILDNTETLETNYEKTVSDVNIEKDINDKKQKVENLSAGDKLGIAFEADNLVFNFVDSIYEKYDIIKDDNWTEQEGLDLINSKDYSFLTFSQKSELINNRNTSFTTLFQSIKKMESEYDNHQMFEQFDGVDSLLYTGGAVMLDPSNFLGGWGAYKTGATFAMKTMLKGRLATTATFAATEGLAGAAQETGLYYTTDYKTTEDIAYAGAFSALLGGPLSSWALKTEMSSATKQLKSQLDFHNNSRNINKLTEVEELKFDVEPMSGTIRLEKEGKVAYLSNDEYDLLRKDIKNIDNINFREYTPKELKAKSELSFSDKYLKIDFLNSIKKETPNDTELHKIADIFGSDYKEGRQAVDFLQKKELDSFEGEIGTAFKNAESQFSKEIGGDINEYLSKTAIEINRGLKDFEELPDYIQDIYNVSNKGAKKIRDKYKEVGIDIPDDQKVYYKRSIDNSKAKALLNNVSENKIKELLKGSLKSEWKTLRGADFDEKVAEKLSNSITKKMYNNIEDVAFGNTGVDLKQNNISAEMNKAIKELVENETDEDTLKLLEQLEYVSKKEVDGSLPSSAKHKMKLDEFYEVELEDGKKINLNDSLYDTNFLNNTTETFRTNVSDAILKKHSKIEYKGKNYDLSKPSDLDKFVKKSKNKKIAKLIQNLQKGKVTEDIWLDTPNLNKMALVVRNLATFMYMGKGYFAAMPEVGMALSKSMLDSGFKNIPEMFSLYKNLKLNKLTPDQKDFMDIIGYYLTSNSQKHAKTILQSGGDSVGGNATFLDKLVSFSDKAADTMVRKIGGISFMDTTGKLLVASSEIDKLRKLVLKGKNLFPNAKRLKASGFSPEDIDKLTNVFKNNKDSSIMNLFKNIEGELGTELNDKLLGYVMRKTDSIINNPTMAENVLHMQNNIFGKTYFQFMNYTATSLGKLTHAGVYYKDAEVMSNLGAAFAFSTIGQMARIHTDTIGSPEKRKEKLEPGVLAWKTFSGTSQFAFPGWVIGSAASITGKNLASGRSSGLSRGVGGSPSLELFERLVTKTIDNGKAAANGTLSVKDLRVITPNVLGVNAFFNSYD